MKFLLVFFGFILQLVPQSTFPTTFIVKTDREVRAKRQVFISQDSVKIVEISVNSDIQFRYSRTVVESLMKNFGTEPETCHFKVVLPNSAFIRNFSMIIKDREYVAEVREKEEAKKEFIQLISQGIGAGLVEKDARNANLFQIEANVEPADKVLFRLTYEELLERRLGKYNHAIHVQPGQIVDKFNIKVNINESLPITFISASDLNNSNTITLSENEIDSVNAVVQRNVDSDPSKASIKYLLTKEYQNSFGEKGLQGEFNVKYDVDRSNQSSEVQVIDGFFVHFFTPENLKVQPKHIIFVLDVSGSMFGEKLQQLKDAMFTILDEMTDEDYFDIITFSSKTNLWIPSGFSVFKASKENKRIGINFILGLQAEGGTNINDALVSALELEQSVRNSEVLKKDVQSIILFMTDGVPTEGVTVESDLLANIRIANSELEVPIFSLAFGRDADFNLVVEISKDANSRAKQIYEGSDAALQLEGFYKEIASPLLSNLKIKYIGTPIISENITNSVQKTFFKGGEYIVAGMLAIPEEVANENDSQFDVSVEAVAGTETYRETLSICLRTTNTTKRHILPLPSPFPSVCLEPVPPPPRSDAQNFIKSLFVFINIKQLLSKGDELSNKKALNLSLENNFVTKLTSLLVKKEDNDVQEAVITDATKDVPTFHSFQLRGGMTLRLAPTFTRDRLANGWSKRHYAAVSPVNGLGKISYAQPMTFANIDSLDSIIDSRIISRCDGTLKLFLKTYNRGENQLFETTSLDLGEFSDKPVSALVDGSCCWQLFSLPHLQGEQLTLGPGKHTSVNSLRNLFRNVGSVNKVNC